MTHAIFPALILLSVSASGLAGCGGDEDDDGTSIDGAPNAAADADPQEATDANPTGADGGTTGQVACLPGPCDLDTEECCSPLKGGTECVASGTCEGYPTRCDGREDCADGLYCCGTIDSTDCQPDTCEGLFVCHVPSDCPTDGDECCPNGACAADCG